MTRHDIPKFSNFIFQRSFNSASVEKNAERSISSSSSLTYIEFLKQTDEIINTVASNVKMLLIGVMTLQRCVLSISCIDDLCGKVITSCPQRRIPQTPSKIKCKQNAKKRNEWNEKFHKYGKVCALQTCWIMFENHRKYCKRKKHDF